MSKHNTNSSLNDDQAFGPVVITKTDAEVIIKQAGSVSGAIRLLDQQGKSRGEIAKILNKRYQHVRNVLITPIKKK